MDLARTPRTAVLLAIFLNASKRWRDAVAAFRRFSWAELIPQAGCRDSAANREKGLLYLVRLLRNCALCWLVLTLVVLAGCGGLAVPSGRTQPPVVPVIPPAGGDPAGNPPSVPAPPMPAPAPATAGNAIQTLHGWQSCTAKLNGGPCASGRGNAVFSMRQGVTAPSLDGQAAQFSIAGPVGYSNALWWKELGGNNAAHNFTYDLYVYLIQPNLPQSLEFDVNQSVSDKNLKFIFGTECDLQGTHTWHNWDTAHAVWRSTSVPCTPFAPYTWNHLVLQFQRTANDMIRFVAVSINGETHYFNKQFSPERMSAFELNVAFQMDGNSRQAPYSVWLDKVTLTVS